MCTTVQNVSLQVMYMRYMRDMVRGTLTGFIYFIAGIGTTIFLAFTIYFFYHSPPAASFVVVGWADMVAMLGSVIVFYLGIVKRDD